MEYLDGGFALAIRTIAHSIPMKLGGVWNITVQRTTDNIMRKLGDERWFEYKKNLARERADRAMSGMATRTN
jgi:hypothetical protein